MRIGAEYHDPMDRESHPVQYGRLHFLARIEKVAPEVLTTLCDDVLPAFRDAWEEAHPFLRSQFFTRGWNALETMPDMMRGPHLPVLLRTLAAWGGKWHLTDPWVLDDALSTLKHWTENPDSCAGQLYWYAPWGGRSRTLSVPALSPWVPEQESWDGFTRRVEDWMQRNRAAGDAASQAHGWVRAPEKRAQHSGDPFMHHEWLACWQVLERSAAYIASHYDVGKGRRNEFGDETTVIKALKATAEQIGLTRRTE